MPLPMSVNEADRLAVLALYRVLDTPPDFAHDALTELAAQICSDVRHGAFCVGAK